MTTFSDETVMRYVDGELDEETSSALETALETDADLAARLELFAQTRLAAQEAMKPALAEPVPDALRDAVAGMVARSREAPVDPLKAHMTDEAPPPAANDGWRMAAAIGFAAFIGLAGGYFATGPGTPQGLQVAAVDANMLAAILRTTPSGEQRPLTGEATQFRAIASFRDSRKVLCREFELKMRDTSTVTSVACDEGGAWQVRFAVNAPGGSEGYVPASSSDALNAYLTAIEAGEPLSVEDERAALKTISSARE